MERTDLEERLARHERRRHRVVAAAEELRALGAGDLFEGPVDYVPTHRLRCEELVDEIHVLTGYNPDTQPLPSTYRYEWQLEKAEAIREGGIVCQTPAGPCLVMVAGVYYRPQAYPEEIHGCDPIEEEHDARR